MAELGSHVNLGQALKLLTAPEAQTPVVGDREGTSKVCVWSGGIRKRNLELLFPFIQTLHF